MAEYEWKEQAGVVLLGYWLSIVFIMILTPPRCFYKQIKATTETKVCELFGVYGEIKDIFLPKVRGTNDLRGFGFITFADHASAENAIKKINQTQLDGCILQVNVARPRVVDTINRGDRTSRSIRDNPVLVRMVLFRKYLLLS